MSPSAEDDLIGLAAWTMGAFGVGAWGDGKSALDKLRSKVEKHLTLPKSVAARMIADLDAARDELSEGLGRFPECLRTERIASAAGMDLDDDIRRSPLLREPARARLLSELRPLRRDSPEFLLVELLLMRRLAEVALVLDCFDGGLDLSLVEHAFVDPLAKCSALSELFKTLT